MKTRILAMSVLLFVAGMVSGQNIMEVYAPHSKRGDLPPEWLKNKVTPAQYDSLAVFSKYFSVDYDYFKRRDLSRKDIDAFMRRTGQLLSDKDFLDKTVNCRKDTCKYDMVARPEMISPYTCSKGGNCPEDEVKYIIYSEIDGYDAHVMLTARMRRTTEGVVTMSDVQVVPFSVSGLKVSLKAMTVRDSKNPAGMIRDVSFDAEGLSPVYMVVGLLTVEDAMGFVHTKLVNKTIRLKTE